MYNVVYTLVRQTPNKPQDILLLYELFNLCTSNSHSFTPTWYLLMLQNCQLDNVVWYGYYLSFESFVLHDLVIKPENALAYFFFSSTNFLNNSYNNTKLETFDESRLMQNINKYV